MKSHLRAAAVGLGAGLVALAVTAGPALAAEAEIPVHTDHVQTQAVNPKFNNGDDCDAAGPARPGQDAWHFVLRQDKGYVFTKVTGNFAATENGPVIFTAVAPGPNGMFPQAGEATGKHAYLFSPAGLWLVSATATISGTGKDQPERFNLSHTCPGTPTSTSPSPSTSTSPSASTSPSTSTSPSASTSPSESTSPSTSPSESTSPSASTSPSESTSPSSSPDDDDLPTTGSSLTGVLGAGLALLLGGAALVVVARRRRIARS